MVSSLNETIERTINKKIRESLSTKVYLKGLAAYTKYNNTEKLSNVKDTKSFNNFYFNELEENNSYKDTYNNNLHDYLRVKKTQCKFNLMKLFQPGDFLNAVMNS